MDLTANVLEAHFLPWSAREGIVEPDQLTQKVIDKWSAHLLEDPEHLFKLMLGNASLDQSGQCLFIRVNIRRQPKRCA